MVIDEIVLHNFGIFGGRQVIRLDPPSPDQPVVVFGGLNGAGKTTLLEAIQLVLFGKLAPPVRDSQGGYESYLERSIHRSVRPKDGASVELTFRSTGDGRENSYRVRRSWALKRRNISESLDVEVNGAQDPALAETWSDQVHRFLPPQLAPLFLFDGERIESLADPQNAEGFLSVAVDALLGMDLVRQLETDLSVLERRKRAQALSTEARAKFDKENEALDELDEQIRQKREYLGTLRNRLDDLEGRFREVDREYRAQGGELLQRREQLEEKRSEALVAVSGSRRALVELATGALPLTLVQPLLQGVVEQADAERAADDAAADAERLARHQAELKSKLTDVAIGEEAIGILDQYFSELQAKAESRQEHPRYLDLPAGTRDTVHRLMESTLSSESDRAREIVDDLERSLEQLDDIERQLAAVPEPDAIHDIAVEHARLLSEINDTNEEIEAISHEANDLSAKRHRQQERLDELLKHAASEGLDEERRARLLEHSDWARKTLKKFREAAIDRNLNRVQDLILECYQLLLRKKTLVHSVRIDPSRYRIHLFNGEDQEIPSNRLSAGERQLLAVATLWGLARASGRPLPMVIDTPLGRLDGGHRDHLVTRYFPEASHQVLLLSTDEEIVGGYFDRLRPAIGRMYRLDYDDETRSTFVREGYFEEEVAA